MEQQEQTTTPEQVYRAKVNMETSRIAWKELQRFFASGAALYVCSDLDLVEVAYQISQDNREQVVIWLEAGQVAKVADDQAQAWYDADAGMWAVVVSPYVLVQVAK